MKPRHAAALALVGWYLLGTPLPHLLPMEYWTRFGRYDTAKECQQAQIALIRESQRAGFKPPPGPFSADDLREALGASECIATDDPRLKGN
jgi:hypothetical protein